MRRVTSVLVFAFILLPLALWAATDGQALHTQILSASLHSTAIAVEFDGVTLAKQLSAPDPGTRVGDGCGLMLAIAGHGTPIVHVTNVELGDAVTVTSNLDEINVVNSPDQLAFVNDPAVVHDLRVVTVGFRPIMRDANGTIRQVLRLNAEVTTSGSGINEINDPTSLSSAFYGIYHSVISNLDDLYPEMSQRAPGRYLVLGGTRRLESDLPPVPYYQRWLDLKRRKGYTVDVASLRVIYNAVGDSSMYGIRRYLQQEYDNPNKPDLEYAVIVGDIQEMPSLRLSNPEATRDTSAGDNWFFCLAGNDSISDVLHGRISCGDASGYAKYFAKIVSYETNPDTSNLSWFQHATCIAGNFNDGTGIFPSTPVWNMVWAREQLMRDGCITVADTFFYHNDSEDPGEWRTQIRGSINSGSCLVLYRGWASSQVWQYPVFDVTDVDLLINGRKLPAVFSLVCGAGNFAFANGQCLGEEWISNSYCTPSSPQGAIVFMGASDLHTQTRYNNALLAGIMEASMRQGVRSCGALELAGKLEGWREYPSEHAPDGETFNEYGQAYYYILHAFNVLGDPETQIYICLPSNFTVDRPAQVSQGQTLIPITVNSGGSAVEGAVVTLRGPGSTVVSAVRTDASGLAYVPVSFDGAGMAQLTVWKSRYFMKQDSFPVVNTAFDPMVTGINWSSGTDNKPHPGEPANFTLNITNHGSAPATYALTVTSLDPRIVVNSGSAAVPTLAAGAQGTSTPQMTITLGSEMCDGEHPRLRVSFVDGSNNDWRDVEVTVAAPDPVIASLTVNDADGILAAGETANITMTVCNAGGQDAAGLTAQVSSFDNAISFPNNQATWTSIPQGQTAASTTAFTATLASGVTPGRQILLRVAFLQNGVVVARKNYLMPTGVVTINSPTGPDAYGYYAYENIDSIAPGVPYPETPRYQWVELDPAFGGSGAEAHGVRDDTHFAMRLPRAFTYYGQSFDSVWVCSNGWLSFSRTTVPEFRNWDLPSPMGAPNLVCPFWDDLMYAVQIGHKDSLHYVFTRFDDNNRFILQWRTLSGAGYTTAEPDTAWCVFEAILEYPASGDGSIVFQYNRISNIDKTGSGNFATVGIEDDYHERGFAMTFANMYPASADTLRPGRAIRFTTQAPDNFVGTHDPSKPVLPEHFALHEVYPNPFNPSTEVSFDLAVSGRVTLKVYDVLGKEVATLADDNRPAGSYRVSFDGHALPSGIYFARLVSGSNTQVRKMMLVK